jgi:membrane protease YdiL (CAAX protease family)
MLVPGIVLSIYWRKSGNLGVSGGAHALNDSVRNATVGTP